MKNIAIIPARCGSKGLANKNIKLINQKPLIAYSIEAAKQSNLFEEVMLSTDSVEYAEIAKQYGANVPFLRSQETSGDTAGSWDVVAEVLDMYRERGSIFDTVCLLQPTSPLRGQSDIVKAYNLYKSKNADSITSVCEMDHSPLWSMPLPESLSLKDYREGQKNNSRRQDLDQYYRINGAIYIRDIKYELNNIQLINNCEYAYIMDRRNSIDIDTLEDFELAEFWMSKVYNI